MLASSVGLVHGDSISLTHSGNTVIGLSSDRLGFHMSPRCNQIFWMRSTAADRRFFRVLPTS